MHPSAVERMKELLIEALKHLQIKDGGLDLMATHKGLEPLGAFVRKHHGRWLQDEVSELYVFLSIEQAIIDAGVTLTAGKLVDVLPQQQREAIAQRVLAFWSSVPYEYRFVFPMIGIGPVGQDTEIAPGVAFTSVSLDEVDHDGLRFGMSLLEFEGGQKPTKKVPALVIRERGLMLITSASEVPIGAAIRKAKVVLMLGMVDSVFRKGALPLGTPKHITYTPNHGGDQEGGTVNVPSSFGDLLGQMTVAPHPGLLGQQTFAQRMERVGSVLAREGNGDHDELGEQCARMATAAEWLFDAENVPSSAMTFLQTAISLDALYGAGEQEPVRSTLANRIAYTLGRTARERKELHAFVNEFYKTRSKVVHRGASRLDGTQRYQLDNAKEIIQRALSHELRLVGAAVKQLRKATGGGASGNNAE